MAPRYVGVPCWQQEISDDPHKLELENSLDLDKNPSLEEAKAKLANESIMNTPTKCTVTSVGTKKSAKKSVGSKVPGGSKVTIVRAGPSPSKRKSPTSVGLTRITKHIRVSNAKDGTIKSNAAGKLLGDTIHPTKRKKVKKRIVQVKISRRNTLETSLTEINSMMGDDSPYSDVPDEMSGTEAERAAVARLKARPNARLPTRGSRTTTSATEGDPLASETTTTSMTERCSEPVDLEGANERTDNELSADEPDDPPPAPVTPPREPLELEHASPTSSPPLPASSVHKSTEHPAALSWDDPRALEEAASKIAADYMSAATVAVTTTTKFRTAHAIRDGATCEEEEDLANCSTEDSGRHGESLSAQHSTEMEATPTEVSATVASSTERVSPSGSQNSTLEHAVDISEFASQRTHGGGARELEPQGECQTRNGRGVSYWNGVDAGIQKSDSQKSDALDSGQALLSPSRDNEFHEDLRGYDQNSLSQSITCKVGTRVAMQVRMPSAHKFLFFYFQRLNIRWIQRLYYQHLQDTGTFSSTGESFTAGHSFSFGVVHSAREDGFRQSLWMSSEF